MSFNYRWNGRVCVGVDFPRVSYASRSIIIHHLDQYNKEFIQPGRFFVTIFLVRLYEILRGGLMNNTKSRTANDLAYKVH